MQGPLLFEGEPLRHWDMGTFQDTDGKGYLLVHHGPIYELGDDYRSVVRKVAHVEGMGESPAMFHKGGIYYLLTSNLTSWERNDNYYFTATSIEGPWKRQGLFCPEGSLTYNSQSTFVFPLVRGNDTIPMYMGDRWSYPHQASAATCVWLPMHADGERLSIPEYLQAWDVARLEPVELEGTERVTDWSSNYPDDCLRIPFDGGRIAVMGRTDCHSGYAEVCVRDKAGEVLHRSFVDFYSKVPDEGLRFLSKEYPAGGGYVLEVRVTGEYPVYYNKRGGRFGSDDCFVNVSSVVVDI